MKELNFNFYVFIRYFLIIFFLLISISSFNFKCGDSGNDSTNSTTNNNNSSNTTKSRIVKQSTNVIDTINTGIKGELLSVFRFGSARLIAAGENGLIITSSNGGLNWTQRTSNDTIDIYASFMMSTKNYIVGGEGGRILKTVNFGETWQVITTPVSDIIKSISFCDTLNGFAAYGSTSVLKTSDGGFTWAITATTSPQPLNSISMPSFSNIWACGNNGIIMVSTNNGVAWQTQTSGTGNNLNSIYMHNTQHGRVVGNSGTALLTINGGTTWSLENAYTLSNLRMVTVSGPRLAFASGSMLRNQYDLWNNLSLNANIQSTWVSSNYNEAAAVSGGFVYLITVQSCNCTHIIELTHDESTPIKWKLTITPDVNQNLHHTLRIEAGGYIERIVSGWTQYEDGIPINFPNQQSGSWEIRAGNRNVQSSLNITSIPLGGLDLSSNQCDYMQVPIDQVGSTHIRGLEFVLIPILDDSNPDGKIPVDVYILDQNGSSCHAKKYKLELN